MPPSKFGMFMNADILYIVLTNIPSIYDLYNIHLVNKTFHSIALPLLNKLLPTTFNEDGHPWLHVAAKKNWPNLTSRLLALGANISAPALEGNDHGGVFDHSGGYRATALHWACRLGHIAVARLLIAHGADVNAQDEEGVTALQCAISNGHDDVVDLLLASGADVDLANGEGMLAIHYAACCGRLEVLRRLVRKGEGPDDDGARAKKRSNAGFTPLHYAAWGGHEDVITALVVEYGCSVDARCRQGRTPLWFAVTTYNDDADPNTTREVKERVVRLLLKHGADPTSPAAGGWTLLMEMAERGEEGYVKILLEAGANVNARYLFSDWTALHEACKRGHLAIARLLVAYGAKIEAKSRNGATPLTEATRAGHADVVALLRASRADTSAKGSSGKRRSCICI